MPLRDQRYFGAGIKRKRIHFVPSTTASAPSSSLTSPSETPKLSASARYLAVVFNKSHSEPPTSEHARPDEARAVETASTGLCEVCRTPISTSDPASASHSASLVHQICLPHSHPPSHLDRNRVGISILQSHGWDPDARRGLGSAGEGILHPVKAHEKRDTVGLGHGNEDDEEEAATRLKPKKKPVRKEEVKKLDAGAIRKMDLEQKRKDKRLREMFYANDEVEKYLGGG